MFPDGNGVVAARLAHGDPRSRSLALEQLGRVLAFVESEGLRPREAVVLVGQSGRADFADRWDLTKIREGIEGGRTRWVAFQSIDRIARDPRVLDDFIRLLDRSGVDLFLAEHHGPIDLDLAALTHPRLKRGFPRFWGHYG